MGPAQAKHKPTTSQAQAKTIHTTTFLGVSAKYTTQNSGASAKFPPVKFTIANLTWHAPPPPPCSGDPLEHAGINWDPLGPSHL